MAVPLKQFKKKTSNYYSAPPFYQKLFDLGVPERYWYVTQKELHFASISYDDDFDEDNTPGEDGHLYRVSVQKQKKGVNKLLKKKNPSGVVAIGSQPTADMSLAMLFYLAKVFHKKGHKIQVHNMFSGLNYMEITGDVLFIYNINVEDDPRRLQNVRDLLFQTNGLLRIVAFAGDNPLSFFCEKLRFYPNLYLYLVGKYRKVVSSE